MFAEKEENFEIDVDTNNNNFRSIDGVLYEVTAFQCVPWLPDLADEVKILTEGEMLRWLLKNKQE